MKTQRTNLIKQRKRLLCGALAIALLAAWSGCAAEEPPPDTEIILEPETGASTPARPPAPPAPETPPPAPEAPPEGVYISITYGRDNPENFTGREMVFYTYDLAAQELEEVCVLPFDAQYATGVVSRENKTVYYSRRVEAGALHTPDCLFAYDLRTGESTLLEQENWSYNEITLLDENTLLTMAVTTQHPIIPARFDLRSRTFTYLPDVNGEPFTAYTSGSSSLSYNFRTGQFLHIFQSEKDLYDEAYMSFEKAIDTHIALVSADLKKDPAKMYTFSMPVNGAITWATQLSEDTILLQTDEVDALGPDAAHSAGFYTLTFKEGRSTLTPAAPPYPENLIPDVDSCMTCDGGETYFLCLRRADNPSGLFRYRPATGELTPILLDDDAVQGHIVNFQIVGPPAPAEPVLPAEPDYYFMGALYGLGDYPPFSELLDQPDALDRLKQFYTGLSGVVDRVEYHTQSLEYIGTYAGDAKFTSNGAPNGMGDDGQLHTALKTLMVGRAEADAFDGVLESGRGFAEDDFTVRSAEDSIPVLLGHDYCGLYQLGDALTLSLHRQPLRFTVAGFLKSNAAFRFDREIPLDQHIIVPFYDIAYEPADAGNRYYQQVYYTQKCEGFVAIDPAADAEQMFRDVEALAQKYDLLYAVTPVKCRISEDRAAI